MISQPRIEHRPAQHYVAIPAQATLADLPPTLDKLFPEIFAWAGQHGVTPDGPPFIRYLVTDMSKALEFEVGLPVAASTAGDGRVTKGELPSGKYATLVHTGPYAKLVEATGALLDWAREQNVEFDTAQRDGDQVWRARLEYYPTDPSQEPDPEKWETVLAFLTR